MKIWQVKQHFLVILALFVSSCQAGMQWDLNTGLKQIKKHIKSRWYNYRLSYDTIIGKEKRYNYGAEKKLLALLLLDMSQVKGSVDAKKLLVAGGAYIDSTYKEIECYSSGSSPIIDDYYTPLIWSVVCKDLESMRMFLRLGANHECVQGMRVEKKIQDQFEDMLQTLRKDQEHILLQKKRSDSFKLKRKQLEKSEDTSWDKDSLDLVDIEAQVFTGDNTIRKKIIGVVEETLKSRPFFLWLKEIVCECKWKVG